MQGQVLRAWARDKVMARFMGRGSAVARLRDMGRGRGSGSAGRRGKVEGHGQEQCRRG